jgi:uncharacterized protein YdhG (YjbR/CyaY superfamily)
MKKGPVPKNIDEYLVDLPEDVQVVLEKLRHNILAAAPKAEELISYQMPAFKYKGVLVYFAAFKNHCSLFVASKSIMKIFEKELEPFDASGGTIHFTVDKPLPAMLVKRIIKVRVQQNEERAAAKAAMGKGAKVKVK